MILIYKLFTKMKYFTPFNFAYLFTDPCSHPARVDLPSPKLQGQPEDAIFEKGNLQEFGFHL